MTFESKPLFFHQYNLLDLLDFREMYIHTVGRFKGKRSDTQKSIVTSILGEMICITDGFSQS